MILLDKASRSGEIAEDYLAHATGGAPSWTASDATARNMLDHTRGWIAAALWNLDRGRPRWARRMMEEAERAAVQAAICLPQEAGGRARRAAAMRRREDAKLAARARREREDALLAGGETCS